MKKKDIKYSDDVKELIDDLSRPSYITDRFSHIGIDELIILSSVFRADKSYLGAYFANFLFNNNGLYESKSVLDLGSGCGSLGLICALNGAERVVFTDINPTAVKNSQLNILLHGLEEKSLCFTSNLFAEMPKSEGEFDAILFNPPSISGSPRDDAEHALIREDETILKFYEQYPNFLVKNGKVIMPDSSRFDGQLAPRRMVDNRDLPHKIVATDSESDGNFKYIISFR